VQSNAISCRADPDSSASHNCCQAILTRFCTDVPIHLSRDVSQDINAAQALHNFRQGGASYGGLAALFASSAGAAKLTSAERTEIQEPRPADVPSDEVLEAQGASIGRIELDVRQIFDERDARENSGLYH
jgi:hypothetical protein